MGKKKSKPKFVVDEDIATPLLRDKYSGKAKFSSATEFVGREGTEDKEIFKRSVASDRHIITCNVKDYKMIKRSNPQAKIGIVFLNQNKLSQSVDKFGDLLTKMPSHDDYRGKTVSVNSKDIDIK